MLNPTPLEKMLDAQRRPYFLWDGDCTVERFGELLEDADPQVRAYWIGKLMRQAKPDDVFHFVTRGAIESLWPLVERHLGQSRPFWTWILREWRELERANG